MPEIISKIISHLDISSLRFKRLEEDRHQKPSLLKDVVSSPENFKLEAVIENDAIQITIKRR